MFLIKKTLTRNGQKFHVLMTNTHSEVLEFDDRDKAIELVAIMNQNTDNGCHYEVIEVNAPKNAAQPSNKGRDFPLSTEVRDKY
jgi:hypothetical protein